MFTLFALTLVCLAGVADGLRDAMDPKTHRFRPRQP